MECYDGMSDLVNTFRTYCEKAETAFVCSDNDKCKTLGNFSTFGIEDKTADYRAIDLRQSGERYSFTVSEYGKSLCRVHLKAAGKCNVYNALGGVCGNGAAMDSTKRRSCAGWKILSP